MTGQTEDYRQGFRERVCGALVVTVQGSSQCAYVPFTALPRALQGHKVALVVLDDGDFDYQLNRQGENTDG